MLSLVLIIIISGISILFIILSAFSGNSKYSMLGCIRLVSNIYSIKSNIGLVTSPLMSNSSTLIISCYGKVGYYPFFSVLSMIYYSISYLFILFDVINKQVYLSSFTLILNENGKTIIINTTNRIYSLYYFTM